MSETIREPGQAMAFEILVESVKDYAIFMLDPSGHVASWNAGAERTKGYSAAEIIGKDYSCFYTPEDIAAGKPRRNLETALKQGRFEDEGLRVRKDGTRFWADVTITPLFDLAKRHVGYVKVTRDISERKRADEARLAGIIESAMDAIITIDADQRILLFNRAAEQMFGVTSAQALGQSVERFIPARFRATHAQHVRRFGDGGVTTRQMGQLGAIFGLRASGEEFPLEASISQLEVHGAKFFTVILRDITLHKKSEDALKLFRTLIDRITDAIEVIDPKTGHFLDGNERAWSDLGYTREEFLKLGVPDVDPAVDRDRFMQLMDEQRRQGSIILQTEHRRKDGSTFPIEVSARLVNLDREYLVAAVRNVTERRRAESAFRESEERFRMLVEQSLTGIYIIQDDRFVYVNPKMAELFETTAEDLTTHPLYDFCLPEDREKIRTNIQKRLSGEVQSIRYRLHALRKDGRVMQADVHGSRAEYRGRPAVMGTLLDITHRAASEAALRESEERFRQLAASIDEVFWMTDPAKNCMVYISPGYEKIWGRTCQRLYDSPRDWLDAIHPDDRQRVLDAAVTKQEAGIYDEKYRIVRPDGAVRWIHDRAFPVRDAGGNVIRIAGVAKDITTEMQLGAQLRQSQKLEAIGLLAGGIAHDFNNLLTVINGRSDMLLSRLKPDDSARRELELIRSTGERAANLTRQLLAFGRKQVLQPKALNLNSIAESMDRLLRRLLTEELHFVTVLDPNLKLVMADPSQIEQVIMNIAVNARDAMSAGGTLTLETKNAELDESYARMHANVAPGKYVMLAISDTGCGMSEEVKARIFEPFFTTKEQGRGTGLGLSTVYGIVNQSNGHIQVYSEAGKGTSFKIYLPALMTGAQTESPSAFAPAVQRGNELILVVEDEAELRELDRDILEASGFRVLAAANGVEALKVFDQHSAEIQMLLTDVVMPEMGGAKLSEELLRRNPKLKVLFTSGYTDRAILSGGELGAGINYLQKPFSPSALVRKVREVIDK
ncbi:MAG TPA: PAS domain S-box protein [Planctomycetota bacterium]|nr:PAS domain S-box protein [Planctomycetota bacterium]